MTSTKKWKFSKKIIINNYTFSSSCYNYQRIMKVKFITAYNENMMNFFHLQSFLVYNSLRQDQI